MRCRFITGLASLGTELTHCIDDAVDTVAAEGLTPIPVCKPHGDDFMLQWRDYHPVRLPLMRSTCVAH